MATRPRIARAAAPLSSYRIQVLDRTLRILDTLANAESSLTGAELARRLSLHKATAHRLLKVLELQGFVRKDPVLGKYKLGVKLFELGTRAIEQVDLRDSAEPFLRSLVKETRETAHISILDGCHMVAIARVESPWAMRSPSTLGRRSPVYCSSSGKAVLAFLPPDALKALIGQLVFVAYTRNTIANRAAFGAELDRVRTRGYAVDDEEREIGLRCVGAPLFDHTGRVSAAISVSGPAFRLTNRRLPDIARMVISAAQGLSQVLGYTRARSREVGAQHTATLSGLDTLVTNAETTFSADHRGDHRKPPAARRSLS